MNRRSFLKAAAAAFVAPKLLLPDQPERRFWQLDRTMTTDDDLAYLIQVTRDDLEIVRWARSLEAWNTPLLNRIPWADGHLNGPMVWGSR